MVNDEESTRPQRPRAPNLRDPEGTARAILEAATREFAEHGLGGARIDAIATRAGINKRMLYHYYGDKNALYLAVLEAAYARIRAAEAELKLDAMTPEASLLRLAHFTFDYYLANPEFLSLLATENLHKARHISGSERLRSMHALFLGDLGRVLARGAETGVFRGGLDALDIYVTIAALGAFYLSNRHTLTAIFGRDLGEPHRVVAWRNHIGEVVLAFARTDDARPLPVSSTTAPSPTLRQRRNPASPPKG
ncbi:TetR/AcrR family transcriptional regulator [Kaistia algarum]|uniref:TetR/AcrR family transcriptional regulator n=1 Tax=Kaistia algarum TaxID=2083279 RepID=UPI00225AA4EF|nr:TetR/AcrR family transcriptional regulator [Kaistia algarum]MCX5515854.1 TetR/AcrR family transcriptional regulator [Kaistia algarum]